MTRIRQVRLGIALAVAAVAMLIAAGVAAAASLTITAPGSINHSKTYRVTVSGDVGRPAYVILMFQHFKCKSNYPDDQSASINKSDGGALISKKVKKGLFDAHTPSLKGGVKGAVRYCAYLYGANQQWQGKPIKRATTRVVFT